MTNDESIKPFLISQNKDFSHNHQNREVVLNMEGGGSRPRDEALARGSSLNVWNQNHVNSEDPPSKLINEFLDRQKEFGEVSLDMDMNMDELTREGVAAGPRSVAEPSPLREVKVSFRMSTTPSNGDASPSSSCSSISPPSSRREINDYNGAGEILKCTSNALFQTKPSLLRMKTRSRLIDPPEEELELISERLVRQNSTRSGIMATKSTQLKSGVFKSGQTTEDEEEDPFSEEDVPNEFKNSKFSLMALLEWVSLISITAALICSLTIPYLKHDTFKGLKLWKWLVLILVLICGRLVSGWGIRIIVFFIERNFLLRKKVLYFVYGVRKAVKNCLWLGMVLLTWGFLFDEKVATETPNEFLKYVTKILVCLLVATLLWLLKTLMVKVLASSFHMNAYFDRIQESLFNQFVIETLSGPPLIAIQKTALEEESMKSEIDRLQKAGAMLPPDLKATAFPTKSGKIKGSGSLPKNSVGKSARLSRALSTKVGDGITIDHLHRLNHKNVSAWNMKRLVNMVRYGALATLDEQILGSTIEDESATEIRSEREAKKAAKKIFRNVARPHSKYIFPEDLMRFMSEDEALKTLSLFEGTGENARISRACLKNWVVNAFRERRALALTLNDTKTAVNKLHQMVNVLVCVVILITWLLILQIATKETFVFVSSQIVLVAFIFGNTCKTIFESIIFLFFIHPYDVGDRCEIDSMPMIVEEMNILNTIFLKLDNQKIIYPNSTLLAKPIGNYYRSPDMFDTVELCVHTYTPAEKIATLRQRIISYLEIRKEHWYPETTQIVLKDLEDLNMLRIAIWPQHKMNFQDMGERWERRSLLVDEITKILKELDINYRLLPLDIDVRSMPFPVNSTRYPSTWTPPPSN